MDSIERAKERLKHLRLSLSEEDEQLIRSLLARVEELTSVDYQLEQSCSKVGIELTKANDRISELERENTRLLSAHNAYVHDYRELERENEEYKSTECFTPPVTCSDNCSLVNTIRRSVFERAIELAEIWVGRDTREQLIDAIRNEMEKGGVNHGNHG